MNNKEKDRINYLRTIGSRSYYSQACQDLFVLDMLGNKLDGYYCEIGASHPFESNNSFLLERDFSWKGFSIELDAILVNIFNLKRLNSCICHDATTYNYLDKFEASEFPRQIDYLSIDIDPAEGTYRVLKQLPLNEYRFSIITYEHDCYTSGPKYMNLSRKYLDYRGYKLVIANVKCFGRDFEDWWIDPTIVPENVWKKYESRNIEFSDIFK